MAPKKSGMKKAGGARGRPPKGAVKKTSKTVKRRYKITKIERPSQKEGQALPTVEAKTPPQSEEMFQALKQHVLREREKMKKEQEADAEVERQRKEKEAQQKQDAMTLEETREQINQLETHLTGLKEEKHELFLQLKKVLNEDDNRRRMVRQQESSSSEVADVYPGMYTNVPPPMSGHLSQLVVSQPSYPINERNPVYKMPPSSHITSHTLLPPVSARAKGSLKRARSPATPPPPPPPAPIPTTHHQAHYQPAHYAPKPPPPPPPRIAYQKAPPYASYYGPPPATIASSQGVYYPNHQYATTAGSSRGETSQPTETMPPQLSKHQIYLTQPLPRPTINQAYMHSSLADHPKYSTVDDKYYPVPGIRPATHVPLHGGGIPIQQPPQQAVEVTDDEQEDLSDGQNSTPMASSTPLPIRPMPSRTCRKLIWPEVSDSSESDTPSQPSYLAANDSDDSVVWGTNIVKVGLPVLDATYQAPVPVPLIGDEAPLRPVEEHCLPDTNQAQLPVPEQPDSDTPSPPSYLATYDSDDSVVWGTNTVKVCLPVLDATYQAPLPVPLIGGEAPQQLVEAQLPVPEQAKTKNYQSFIRIQHPPPKEQKVTPLWPSSLFKQPDSTKRVLPSRTKKIPPSKKTKYTSVIRVQAPVPGPNPIEAKPSTSREDEKPTDQSERAPKGV